MIKLSTASIILSLSLALAGCVGSVDQGLKSAASTSSTKSSSDSSTSTSGSGTTAASFGGCVSGQGIDTQRISIIYEFPANYTEVFISRDGMEVYSSRNTSKNSFIDSQSLQEGQTYIYECGARDSSGKAYVGSNVLEVGTLVVNPPQFNGVTSAVEDNATTALVSWGAPYGGAIVDHYNIYYNSGNTVDWTLASKETTANTNRSILISGLGDEVPYAFGVRACTATNVCDANTAVSNVILPDTGAARTVGATEINIVAGNLVITAPWSHELGAVKRRKIYQRIGAVGGTNIADYTLLRTEVIADANLGNPNTALVVSNPITSTTYHFIVRDEDPSSNLNSNTNVVSIVTSDLDAPIFAGITSLTNSTPADTVIKATFTAIGSEASGDASGATYYLFYITSADLPAVPADPCSTGTLRATINASAYTSGNTVNYDLTGLSPRKSYKVCVKAKDAVGNISSTTASQSVVTKDITPPVFDGAQIVSFNNALQRMDVSWNFSPSDDILEYRTRIWNAATPGNVTTITKTHAANPSGFSFTSSEFPMASGDVIHVVVNACDNSVPTYNTSANCSSYADASAKIVTLPDIQAPVDFLGIGGTAACTPASNGCKKVSWSAPLGGWADYLGFKIYSVAPDNTLTWLKDCVCTANNCVANPLTSCDVNGLGVGQTYHLYVRGYDQAGNLTAATNPWANKMSGKSGDVSAPIFNAGLSVSNQTDGNHTAWTVATDNQVDSTVESGNVITYELYRKTTTTFTGASVTANAPDGLLVYSGQNLSYTDPSAGLATGTTYFYTACAKDASANKICDGDIKSILVPDNDPPPGFSGITAAGLCSVNADGCLKASWNAPAVWTDYRGFKVYSVAADNSLTLLKICSCAASGCAEHPVSCEVTGLDSGRTYNLFVSAYDTAGNVTDQTNAYAMRRSARAGDVTAPAFNSGMSASWQASPTGVKLNWNQATDNQYATGNFVGYTVYRKVGSTFSGASITAKSPDGSAITATTSTNFLDPSIGLTEGLTYYYTVCAYDGSTPANTTCDGVIQSVTAPDVSPPPGFSGIQAAALCTPNANGCARVSWLAPASWLDYAGFEVYSVASDDTLTLLNNCACTANNCSANNKTYCEVTIADAAKTTNYYVRAYDALGNKTAVISPYANRRTIKTGDVSPPSFFSFLTAAYQASPAGIKINWNTALSTDNQFFDMTNTISYKVYRKVGSTFTALTIANGTPDGTLISTSVSDNFLDPQAALTGGMTHYYTVCALDTAGNTYCDNNIKSVTLADITPPTLTGLSVNTATVARSVNYTLSWAIADNATPAGSIMVNIRRKASDVQNDYPVAADPILSSGNGLTSFVDNYNPAPQLVKWVNYTISARDAAGNESVGASLSVRIAGTTITDTNYTEYQNVDWVLDTGTTVTFQSNAQVSINSLTMNGTSRITSAACTSVACYKVNLKVLGNATIGASASIDVTGKGYTQGWNSCYLVTYNFNMIGTSLGAGPHGGSGGYANASSAVLPVYGSIKNPLTYGSRGGEPSCTGTSAGGGVVVLDVAGILDIEGTILANGLSSVGGLTAGSSGGSINITADQIKNTDGTVTVSAIGSNALSNQAPNAAGGGGGGRIAVYYNTLSGINITSISQFDARGGNDSYSGGIGQAGTIYYKSGTDIDGHLLINNAGRVGTTGYTYLNYGLGSNNYFDSITVMGGAKLYQDALTINADVLNINTGGTYYAPAAGDWLHYNSGTQTPDLATTLIRY